MKLIAVLAALLGLALAAAVYYGALAPLEVREKKLGPWVSLSLEHKGAYKGTYQKIQEVQRKAKDLGIAEGKSYGLYLDSPKQVKEADLRSEGGILLDVLDKAERDKAEQAGLKVKDWPEQRYLSLELPFRGMPSIFIGILRAYPALEKARVAKNVAQGPGMEIYEARTINYLLPLQGASK